MPAKKRPMLLLLMVCMALLSLALSPNARANTGAGMTRLFATADNATTSTSNPAGLTRIRRPEWVVQVLAFGSESTFVTTEDSFDGVTVDDSDGSLVVPFIYYARPINDRLGFGISLTGTGGLGEDLDDAGPQRYLLEEWSMAFGSLSPALGYRINEQWSAGVAVNINFTQFT